MTIVGIDEVGRGCWAGPLVASAVILDGSIPGLADSKVVSKLRRKELAKLIYLNAKSVSLGWVSAKRIDAIGLSAANREAMQQALDGIIGQYEKIIIDGNYNYLADNPKAEAIIKADGSIDSVSAASIVAKVARDAYMVEMAMQYPEYGFEKHVGYGTNYHYEQLKKHGVCELHRTSYKPLQALMNSSDTINA